MSCHTTSSKGVTVTLTHLNIVFACVYGPVMYYFQVWRFLTLLLNSDQPPPQALPKQTRICLKSLAKEQLIAKRPRIVKQKNLKQTILSKTNHSTICLEASPLLPVALLVAPALLPAQGQVSAVPAGWAHPARSNLSVFAMDKWVPRNGGHVGLLGASALRSCLISCGKIYGHLWCTSIFQHVTSTNM